jgi:hypothetical protein
MTRKLSKDSLYRIRSPENFASAMRDDVRLLAEHRRYVTCTTVILCCVDALSAGTGRATRGKFVAFVTRHFPELCQDLERTVPGRPGAETLYDKYRNGFGHLRGPKSGFAIAEEHEVGGRYADEIEVEGVGPFVALNVDRLTSDFLLFLGRLDTRAA